MSRQGIDHDRSTVADRVLPRRSAGSTCQFRPHRGSADSSPRRCRL